MSSAGVTPVDVFSTVFMMRWTLGAVQMTTYRGRGYQRVMHEDVVTLID